MNILDDVLITYSSIEKSIIVPNGVKYIANSAFSYSEIEFVKLPNTLVQIGHGAFRKCINLQEIKFPQGLMSIGAEAFLGCVSLKNINIPQKINSILTSSFQNCGLVNIEIPSNVKRIYWGAFRQCEYLEKVVIKSGVESIGDCAFEFCANLKIVQIPQTVTQIDTNAFFMSDKVTFEIVKNSFAVPAQ